MVKKSKWGLEQTPASLFKTDDKTNKFIHALLDDKKEVKACIVAKAFATLSPW